MSHILVVEDDPILGRSLCVTLELENYKITWARDLNSARESNNKESFDLVLLDVNLPDGSGLSLCSEIRATGSRLPVLFLTAKTDEDSVVAGFTAGANDYVRKPFGHRELLARIKSILREPLKRDAQIRYENLLLLTEKRKVYLGDEEVELNRREFDILSIFVQQSEAVVTREALLSSLDKEGEIFDRTIDSHVSHIRAKLKKAGAESIHISSVYGVGYRLEKK